MVWAYALESILADGIDLDSKWAYKSGSFSEGDFISESSVNERWQSKYNWIIEDLILWGKLFISLTDQYHLELLNQTSFIFLTL